MHFPELTMTGIPGGVVPEAVDLYYLVHPRRMAEYTVTFKDPRRKPRTVTALSHHEAKHKASQLFRYAKSTKVELSPRYQHLNQYNHLTSLEAATNYQAQLDYERAIRKLYQRSEYADIQGLLGYGWRTHWFKDVTVSTCVNCRRRVHINQLIVFTDRHEPWSYSGPYCFAYEGCMFWMNLCNMLGTFARDAVRFKRALLEAHS